jgi:hypothetical protein
MGEAQIKKSATAKLIEQFPLCSLCGGLRPSTTRDHIPPKAIFDRSHRPDKLVMPACNECNGGTSTADLIASIICRWNYHADSQELADSSRLVARLRKQCPEVIKEWTNRDAVGRERGRQHLLKHGVPVPNDAGIVSIGKISIGYLNLFAYKIALGLYFNHFQMPLLNSGLVSAIWRTKEDFEKLGFPKELLEIFPKYAALQQGRWDTSKDFEYRFDLNEVDGIFGCVARFRTGLFITGFALRDANTLPREELSDGDWIRPTDLLNILSSPQFERRLQ